ncbi:hypothetical protein ACFLUZ_04890 [Chloroflexota bacterium]
MEAGRGAETRLVQEDKGKVAETLAFFKEQGVTFYKLSEEDRDKWIAACPDTPAELAEDLESKGFPGYQMVKRYQELLKGMGVRISREWGVKK